MTTARQYFDDITAITFRFTAATFAVLYCTCTTSLLRRQYVCAGPMFLCAVLCGRGLRVRVTSPYTSFRSRYLEPSEPIHRLAMREFPLPQTFPVAIEAMMDHHRHQPACVTTTGRRPLLGIRPSNHRSYLTCAIRIHSSHSRSLHRVFFPAIVSRLTSISLARACSLTCFTFLSAPRLTFLP